jgi:hypothetical protein
MYMLALCFFEGFNKGSTEFFATTSHDPHGAQEIGYRHVVLSL